jgi:hypothetical protein
MKNKHNFNIDSNIIITKVPIKFLIGTHLDKKNFDENALIWEIINYFYQNDTDLFTVKNLNYFIFKSDLSLKTEKQIEKIVLNLLESKILIDGNRKKQYKLNKYPEYYARKH